MAAPSRRFQPKRLLVTGAKGFVGTYFREAAAIRWPDAKIHSLATQSEATPGFIAADLLDRQAIDRAVEAARPDVVIHLAAQASVGRGLSDTDETWAVNVSGSLNLASAVARYVSDATVLFVSSSEVYGASFLGGARVAETSAIQPMNAYARSKAVAERVFADVLPPNAKLIIARPFNHTGPGQREDFVLASFTGQVARIEVGLQPPRLDVGNLDVARDFLDVRDVVDAYVSLIEASRGLPDRLICNVASNAARPLREHVATLQSLAHRPFEIFVDPARMRPVDIPVAAGDATLLHALTGWTPQYELTNTLRGMLDAARVQAGQVA